MGLMTFFRLRWSLLGSLLTSGTWQPEANTVRARDFKLDQLVEVNMCSKNLLTFKNMMTRALMYFWSQHSNSEKKLVSVYC